MRLLSIPLVLTVILTGACGGGGGGGGSNVPGGGGGGGGGDTGAPTQFRFTDVTGKAVSTVVTSNAVTISGTGSSWAISVSGGQYSIGCGTRFTAAAGTIAKGQTVCVRHTTSSTNSAKVDTALTIGGVSDTFSSTTVAAADTSLRNAVIYAGRGAYDARYAVINYAVSVLDASNNPIDHLDGGDFLVMADGATTVDPEGHYDAQRLPYPAQLTGGIVLMLDTSDSLWSRFTELKTAAKRLVDQAAAFGLPVTVYAFDRTETNVGTVAGGGDTTALKAAIDALTTDTQPTYFYSVIAHRITLEQAANNVIYTHNPRGVPTANVELMVIMSDGRDNSGTGSTVDITDAKAGAFNVVSIPVGADADTAGLSSISEFQFTVPAGGTYSDAVDNAMNKLRNYYHGFYVLDYTPTVLEGASATFVTRLVGNSKTSLSLTYAPDDAGLAGRDILPPECCVIRADPSADLSGVSLASNATITFKAVQLWTAVQPTFTWTLTNLDGRLTMTPSADSTSARVQSNGGTSTGTLGVTDGTWVGGPITINVP